MGRQIIRILLDLHNPYKPGTGDWEANNSPNKTHDLLLSFSTYANSRMPGPYEE